MKRALALFLAIIMIVGMIPMGAFADETARIYFETSVEDASALKIGDTFTVTAYLENNPGFSALQWELTWANDVVRFDGYTTYEEDGEEYLVSSVAKANYAPVYNQETSTIVVGVESNKTPNGKICEANFTILKDGDAEIGLKTDWPNFELKRADQSDVPVTIDQTALEGLTITHECDYKETVVDPTCTEGGYTEYKCACGDSYTANNTSALGHNYADGVCTRCGEAGTAIPEGAKFTDMLTDKGEIVTVTEKDGYYLVEVPYGTNSLMVTYPEDLPKVDEFGYVTTRMVGFDGVSQDGYGITRKDGKIIVGLALEKAPSNGAPTVVRLINLDNEYGKKITVCMADGSEETFALTYKLGNGQHFAVLPLPENCVGYAIAGLPIASDGYTFNVSILEGYEATENFAVKVNGKTVATEPGNVSIPSVTEDLKVTVEGVGKVQNNTTDVIFNVDLTGAPEGMTGDIMIQDRNYNFIEEAVASGQMSTAAITAGDHEYTKLRVYGVNESLITGWEVNGTVYAAGGKQYVGDLTIWNRGYYLQVEYNGTTPITVNVKPVVEEGHIHDYESVVTPPTCTEGGYTTYTCKAGDDTYVAERVPALGHTNVNGTCSVCGAALTVIPEGAPFLDIMTSDGKAVTVTEMGSDPWYYMGTLYKVEVPMGTTQVNITYNEGDVNVDEFGYATTYMTGFSNVTQDGYGQTTKDGKTTVGLQMEKTPANGSAGMIKLLNIPYNEDDLRGVGMGKLDFSNLHFFAFTYKLDEGQYYANLPSSFMYTVTGDGIASNGYSFNVALKDGYEATEDFAVKVNGVTVATQPGDVTLASVTEDLFVTVEGVAKIYNPETDISITVDLSEYTGEVSGNIWFEKKNSESFTADLVAGKKNTMIVEAADLYRMWATIYSIGSDVIGYDVNGEMHDPGYYSFGFGPRDNAQPGKYVIKPIVEKVEEKEPNPITEIEISHPSIQKDETTGALSMTVYPGASKNLDMNFTVANAQLEATQIVFWSSDNESVATVEQNGTITAKAPGTAVITAKAVDASGVAAAAEDEEVLVSIAITVPDVDNTEEQTYTVQMPGDSDVSVGETVSIPVTVGHTGEVSIFNSYDITVSYDESLLELTSTEIEGATVTEGEGTVNIKRYGADLSVDSAAFTLTFKTLDSGTAEVEVTEAYVSESATALDKDADEALILNDTTVIKITGYTVSLPEEFKGDATVESGKDYTFTAKDKNYDYTVTAKIGEAEIPVTDNDDGTFTIAAKDITGNVIITTTKAGKTFDVTLGDDMTSDAANAQYMTDYVATLTKDGNYNYTVEVTIGGVNYTGFTYDNDTGLITIPGEAITGAIVFDTNKTAKTQDKHSVTISGNSGDVTAEQEATNGQDYTFTINKEVGYTYTVTATMNGETVEVIDNGDGTYTIQSVTGDLVITVTKTYDMEVEVKQYVTLNGKSMFLVTAKATVDESYALAYAESTMYYSEVYGAWSWLVITDSTLTVEDAKAQITLVKADKVALAATNDVNESGKVDINDAQLVFDMYNNEYQDFTVATMQKFLKADVSGDKKIDVNDAVAIVTAILAGK